MNPQALPVWLAAGAIAALALIGLGLWIRARAFRWYGLRELRRLEREWRRTGQFSPLFQGLSRLLRRSARKLATERPVAGLSGHAWLVFLDETAGTRGFTHGVGRTLAEYPYRDETALCREAIDVPEILDLVRYWLRHARRQDGWP